MGLRARWLTRLAFTAPLAAGAQDGPPSLSSARVAAQVGGATLVAPIAFFGSGVVTKRLARKMGADNERAGRSAYIAAYSATWLATAAVPAVVGRDGRFPAALGGSALGMLAAVGVARVGNWRYDADRRECGVLCWGLGALVVALPGIGATIAYDQSRH